MQYKSWRPNQVLILIQHLLLILVFVRAYLSLGKVEEASTYLQKALKIRESTLGDDHSYTAVIYDEIGNLNNAENQIEKSLQNLSQALKIRETKLGKDNIYTAITYHNLGKAYYKKGEYDKALEYTFKAIKIQEVKLGEDKLGTAKTYTTLGLLYFDKKDYIEAMKYLQKAEIVFLKYSFYKQQLDDLQQKILEIKVQIKLEEKQDE